MRCARSLGATRGLPVEAVQIAASAAQGRVAARGRLSAEGSMAAVVRLAERLVAAESGLRVDRIELVADSRAGGRGIRLDVDVILERAGVVSARALAGVLLAAGLLAAAVALRARSEASPAPAPSSPPRPAQPVAARAAAGEAAVDIDRLRDVFRFAEEVPQGRSARDAVAPRLQPVATPPPAPEGPRLVGLVRRRGRLAAALAVDGEVVLALPGEPAGGVTVLSVAEEGVRVRLRDGSERELLPPE